MVKFSNHEKYGYIWWLKIFGKNRALVSIQSSFFIFKHSWPGSCDSHSWILHQHKQFRSNPAKKSCSNFWKNIFRSISTLSWVQNVWNCKIKAKWSYGVQKSKTRSSKNSSYRRKTIKKILRLLFKLCSNLWLSSVKIFLLLSQFL